MADPITLSLFHAVPAALSAGTAYVKHRQQKQAAEEAEWKAKNAQWKAKKQSALAIYNNLQARLRRADEIFEVLTDIGVMLFRLEVADRAKAKAAWKEVDDVLSKKGTVIGMAFEAAKKRKTYGFSTSASKARTIHLIAGLAFCAACFPQWSSLPRQARVRPKSLPDDRVTRWLDGLDGLDGLDVHFRVIRTEKKTPRTKVS
jgi:hypothetical protein